METTNLRFIVQVAASQVVMKSTSTSPVPSRFTPRVPKGKLFTLEHTMCVIRSVVMFWHDPPGRWADTADTAQSNWYPELHIQNKTKLHRLGGWRTVYFKGLWSKGASIYVENFAVVIYGRPLIQIFSLPPSIQVLSQPWLVPLPQRPLVRPHRPPPRRTQPLPLFRPRRIWDERGEWNLNLKLPQKNPKTFYLQDTIDVSAKLLHVCCPRNLIELLNGLISC